MLFQGYVSEHDVDIMIVTETWLRSDDLVIINECTPPGYAFLNAPRPGSAHGGIAVIFRTPLGFRLDTQPSLTFTTFELAHVVNKAGTFHFLIVYRPPPSSA